MSVFLHQFNTHSRLGWDVDSGRGWGWECWAYTNSLYFHHEPKSALKHKVIQRKILCIGSTTAPKASDSFPWFRFYPRPLASHFFCPYSLYSKGTGMNIFIHTQHKETLQSPLWAGMASTESHLLPPSAFFSPKHRQFSS